MARTIVKAVVAMAVGAVVVGDVAVGAVAVGAVVVGAVVPGLMGQRRCQLPGLESRAGGGAGALAGVRVRWRREKGGPISARAIGPVAGVYGSRSSR